MIRYPAKLTADRESGGFVVTFPDVPEAITQGNDVPDALHHAVGALETAIMIYMDRDRDLPSPSRARKGLHWVTLPVLSEAKVALYQAMRTAHLRRPELARKLRIPGAEVDRLLDLRRSSRFEQIEAALTALNKRLVLAVEDAA